MPMGEIPDLAVHSFAFIIGAVMGTRLLVESYTKRRLLWMKSAE
jgi:hypothetical protein